MKKSLFSLLLMAMIISCDDEPEAPSPFLTIDNGELYIFSGEYWVFASDADGRIIDIQSINGKRSIELMTTEKGLSTVDLTLAYVYETPTGKSFNFNTYTNVATDRVLKIYHFPGHGAFSGTGDLKVNLANYSEDQNNPNNLLFSVLPDGYNPGTMRQTSNSLYVATMAVPVSQGELVVSGHRNDEPVYWKGPVGPGEIWLDFNSFMPQENIMTLPSGTTGYIFGSTNPSSRVRAMLAQVWVAPPAQAKVGYVPGFSHYFTEVYTIGTEADGWVSAMYQNSGTRSNGISFTKPTIDVIDKTPDNFQMTTSSAYDYKSVSWSFGGRDNSIHWTVHSDGNTDARIKCDIPSVFKNEGYFVTKENLKNVLIQLTVSNGTYTYNDLTNEALYNENKKLLYERTTFSKWAL